MIRSLTSRLKQYDPLEARSIILLLLQEVFGMSLTDICAGALNGLSNSEQKLLERLVLRLEHGEPVQYVIGHTYFCGMKFKVRRGCLIPRPETEELCRWITEDTDATGKDILDIGTGSGCIAISLSKLLNGSHVSAWDISQSALDIAQENAIMNDTNIHFKLRDALNLPADTATWDIIVSNPPYICRKEAKDMEANVLDFEPDNALFVPDDTPLLFYSSIIRYAKHALKPQGRLYFEINPLYTSNLKEEFTSNGFRNFEIKEDLYGKPRMACGTV